METFKFADDAPRSDPWTQDDFGYRRFAQRLAQVVTQLDAPNGYVIGLHGAWGSGKTTALNFVRHFVDAENKKGQGQPIEMILFQPWIFSGQQDLISAYFRVLAETLKDNTDRLKAMGRKAGKLAKDAVDPLAKAAVTLAAATHPPDAGVINISAALAKSAMTQTIDAWLGEPTLQSAYTDLVSKLRASKRRFFVTIDDIDRLEPGEIRSIMQMVKSVGQLPNVVYVLAYDRRIVLRALSEREARRDGEPTFTDKIVQHEVELPHAGKSALLNRLNTELDFLLSKIQVDSRWFEILGHGVHRWIRNPRDIIRFSNALRFAWTPLDGEVDAADVVAMEGIRLFEPEAFNWIRDNRDYLVADSVRYRSEEDTKALIEAFKASIPEASRPDVVALTALLFSPKAKELRDKRQYSGELWTELVKRGGVGAVRGYDAYFSLFPAEGGVKKSLIDQAVASPDDLVLQEQCLREAIDARDDSGQSLVADYMAEVQFRLTGKGQFTPGLALLRALIKFGDEILGEERRGMMVLPPSAQLQFLVRDMLAAWGLPTASKNFVEAIEGCDSAAVAASLWVYRAREAGVLPDEGVEATPRIDLSALERVGKRTLMLIRRQAKTGQLAKAPFFWDIMWAWSKLGGLKAPKAWLARIARQDAHAVATIARGLLAYSMSDAGERVYSFRGVADREFYDLQALESASVKFAHDPTLSQDERNRVITLRDGLTAARLRQEGSPPEPAFEQPPAQRRRRPAAQKSVSTMPLKPRPRPRKPPPTQ